MNDPRKIVDRRLTLLVVACRALLVERMPAAEAVAHPQAVIGSLNYCVRSVFANLSSCIVIGGANFAVGVMLYSNLCQSNGNGFIDVQAVSTYRLRLRDKIQAGVMHITLRVA